MIIFAIDPNYTHSAWIVWDASTRSLLGHGLESNEDLDRRIRNRAVGIGDVVVIEDIDCMGQVVGREVFDTCKWIGRFIGAAITRGIECDLIPRRYVKLHLCDSARAKDPNIRQAVLDRFGGKTLAVGVKLAPGPLYGVHGSHKIAAIAVALTWADQHETHHVQTLSVVRR